MMVAAFILSFKRPAHRRDPTKKARKVQKLRFFLNYLESLCDGIKEEAIIFSSIQVKSLFLNGE
jgi:hypothetical protein